MNKEKIYELFDLGEPVTCLMEVLRSFHLPRILKETKKEFEEQNKDLEENREQFIDIIREKLRMVKEKMTKDSKK